MSLSAHDDYLPVVDLFLGYWGLADAAALAGPGGVAIVVLGGVGAPELLALRGELAGKREEVRHEELSLRLAGAALHLHREELLLRLGQFNEAARAWWGSGPEGAAVPRAPSITSAVDKFLLPVREALRLWARLDAGAAPSGVALPLTVGGEGTFGRVEMQALLAAALTARDEMEAAAFLLRMLRAERDALEGRVRAVLTAFLLAVPVCLGADHAVSVSLPGLWPLPGHTPAPVPAAGAWEPDISAARLSWEPSAEAQLSHYEVRWCPGRVYATKKERVAGRVPADGREFLARHGLGSPGAVACYKVYVILKQTGNERGSKPVRVRRQM